MWPTLKRLLVGIALIAGASAALLLSDRRDRSTKSDGLPRVAVLQHASQDIIDEGVDGMLVGLREEGFVADRTISIRRYNAEGDVPTANAIAKEMTSQGYDLVLTATTLSMQAFANANRTSGTKHVFALVTDPFGAGVGISRENPLDHPPYMAGYGTMQPVAEALRIARQMFPRLRRVGMAWNPAEANSEVATKLARNACREVGVELAEAPVENSAGVAEAASALVARGAEALWVAGDVTVMTALDTVVAAGRKGRIPVFTNLPGSARRGSLFDVGANYHEVGRVAGVLGGKILNGLDPAEVRIENFVPKTILINREALADLRDPWRVPDDLAEKAQFLDDEPDASVAKDAALGRTWNIDILEYVDIPEVEESQQGILDGLEASGLVEQRDYVVRVRNAQGDMPTLSALVDAALADGTDLIMPLSTPTLQATLQKVRDRPIVFTLIANPLIAGAGRTNEDHLPNVTGVSTASAYAEVVHLMKTLVPPATRVGPVLVPAEVNMVYNKEQVAKVLDGLGIELVEVAANTSAEISDAAAALCSQEIDAVVQIAGNLTTSGFTAIHRTAERAGLPTFGFLTSNARDGAVAVVARDYYDSGIEAGRMAAAVMRGKKPSAMPFQPLQATKLILNLESARAVGLTVPPEIVDSAAEVMGE
jgi:ABC-type uncharacterized transport system substrate-binding protein